MHRLAVLPFRAMTPSPFRTSVFRVAMAYMGLFALSGVALVGFIYWTTTAVIDSQADATVDAEIVGLVEQYQRDGIDGLARSIRLRVQGIRPEGGIYLLTQPDYSLIVGNLRGWPRQEPNADGWLEFPIEELSRPNAPSSIARARTFKLAGDFHLLVGQDLTERRIFQRIVVLSLVGGLGVVLVLGLAGGIVTGRNLLRRLDGINATSAEILAGSLDRRVPVGRRNDEFDRLAENLNQMLDRIERLMTGMREVTDNVAHDLRSPLTRLRGRLELLLLGRPAENEDRRAVEQAIGEVDDLLGTFNALLSIAQAEAGTPRAGFQPLDLADVARDVAELYEPLAEAKGIAFAMDLSPGQVVQGDRHLLSQALANLLDNAVKYTPAGGRIALSVTKNRSVVVADTGPGVPEALRGKVLERFVRLEQSRSTSGSGLGLSLVSAVAKLHRAELALDDNHPGLKVTLAFPT
ncbi:MAG TPA: HAMP domain-containing sensor histidine kinase [Candidatus Cybelea sp.]|nr:HAMP domain-containing sensor histidine kinase [Candidatus Cybelea sp.]